MTKVLLHELGKSISFGRLSLPAKVLWPMLLAASDDQGRGQAEADVLKWTICPNVQELTVENIPALLQEMADQEMVCLYADSRGRALYQIVRWWEYQSPQWAQPSRYQAPEGWADRVRANRRGTEYIEENWGNGGGFDGNDGENPGENAGEEAPPVEQNPPGNPPGTTKESKISSKQSNIKQSNPPSAEKPPDDPPPEESESEKPNLTEGQRKFLSAFGAKRFRLIVQRDAVLAMERKHGTAKLIEGATWAAKRGMNVGQAIISLETALPKWGQPKGQKRNEPRVEIATGLGERA